MNIIRKSLFLCLVALYLFPISSLVKFCGGFSFFFIWETKKSGRWSSYTVTIVWEFALADPVLVVLDEWSSYRGGRLNRFDCGLLLIYTLVVFTSNQLCNAIS